MVSGLLVSSKYGFNMKLENLNPIEEFGELELLKQYGFGLGWYTFGQNIHVVLKQTNKGKNEIYLAEKIVEVEPIINKLVDKVVEDFGVNAEDQKGMFNPVYCS